MDHSINKTKVKNKSRKSCRNNFNSPKFDTYKLTSTFTSEIEKEEVHNWKDIRDKIINKAQHLLSIQFS